MTIAVRYCSRTGNTKKLAEAIAAAVGVEAKTVDAPLEYPVDMLFLGSAVYAAGVDPSVKAFLRANKDKIGTVYSFSTAALILSTYKQIKKITAQNGIALSEKEFHCRGAFSLLHRGHPDQGDLLRASSFAKLAVESAEKRK